MKAVYRRQDRDRNQRSPYQDSMQTYHYLLASQKFLIDEEPLHEVFDERHRNYQEQNKEVDFWLVKQPAFLDTPEFAKVKAACPSPVLPLFPLIFSLFCG